MLMYLNGGLMLLLMLPTLIAGAQTQKLIWTDVTGKQELYLGTQLGKGYIGKIYTVAERSVDPMVDQQGWLIKVLPESEGTKVLSTDDFQQFVKRTSKNPKSRILPYTPYVQAILLDTETNISTPVYFTRMPRVTPLTDLSSELRLSNLTHKNPAERREQVRLMTHIAVEIFLAVRELRETDHVHLDIKPDNLGIQNNRITILDYDGIVNLNRPGRKAKYYAADYLAPESISSKWDIEYSDTFAIGVTLYHLFVNNRWNNANPTIPASTYAQEKRPSRVPSRAAIQPQIILQAIKDLKQYNLEDADLKTLGNVFLAMMMVVNHDPESRLQAYTTIAGVAENLSSADRAMIEKAQADYLNAIMACSRVFRQKLVRRHEAENRRIKK